MTRLFVSAVLALALAACGGSAPAVDTVSRDEAELALADATVAMSQAEDAPASVETSVRENVQNARIALAEDRFEETVHLSRMASLRLQVAQLESEIASTAPPLSDDERRLRIPDAFQSARTTLRSGPRRAVDSLAAYLVANPMRAVLIESFTDATGDESRNLDLSVRRAAAIRERLIEAGVDAAHVATEGYGQAFPIEDNSTSEGQRQNRRIEIVIADAVDALPTRRGDS